MPPDIELLFHFPDRAKCSSMSFVMYWVCILKSELMTYTDLTYVA